MMIPLSEIHFPLNRVNSFVKSVVVCFYLTFVVINGFHHHAFSLSAETGFSPFGTQDRTDRSSHDRDHCPVCIFSSSQDISESSVIVTHTGIVPVSVCDKAEQLIYDIVIGFYSPRAPPAVS